MIINWKKQNPNTIPYTISEGGKTVSGKQRLLQGLNTVPDKVWEGCKKNLTPHDKQFYEEIDDSITEPVTVEVEKDDPKNKGEKIKVKKTTNKKVPSGLRSFEATKCKDMIDDCFNVETLEGWREKETRDEVRAYLKEKLDAILKDNMTKEKQDNKNKSKKKKQGRK